MFNDVSVEDRDIDINDASVIFWHPLISRHVREEFDNSLNAISVTVFWLHHRIIKDCRDELPDSAIIATSVMVCCEHMDISREHSGDTFARDINDVSVVYVLSIKCDIHVLRKCEEKV